MASYGSDADYHPTAAPLPDAKTRFDRQLMASDKAAKVAKRTVEGLKHAAEIANNDPAANDAISHKCEYLKACVSVYIAVKQSFKMRDMHMEKRDAPDEEPDNKIYDKMTASLQVFENRFYQLVKAPDNWFSLQAVRMKNWAQANPMVASGVVVTTTVVGGAPTGAFFRHSGYCCIRYLCLGSTCQAGSLGSSIATGAGIGLGLGVAAIILASIACKVYDYHYVTDNAAKSLANIKGMAEDIAKVEDKQFLQMIKGINDLLEDTMPACIPQSSEDRLCVICLARHDDVRHPIKAPRCKGNHFMCKACWIQCMAQHGDKCTVCRV